MGWLRRFRKSESEMLISLRERGAEPHATEWEGWAADHGWTYQSDAPELVGRYRPEYTAGAERYSHLLTTTLHGFPIKAFEHLIESVDDSRSSGSLRSFLVLGLPGLAPDDVVREGPERAIRRLGGDIPSDYDVELDGSELVASRVGGLNPKRLQPDAELFAAELATLPASFWRQP